MLEDCAGKIRGLFCLAQGYRFLGVDRAALAQGTVEAEEAHKAMGEVPEAVLTGERRALLRPRKAPFAGPEDRLHPVVSPSPESPRPEPDAGAD